MSIYSALPALISTQQHNRDEDIKIEVSPNTPQLSSIPVNSICSFKKKSFEVLVPQYLDNSHVTYVVARLWDQYAQIPCYADAIELQTHMRNCQNSEDKILRLPKSSITEIKKIEYFSTASKKAPFKWTWLETTPVTKDTKPSLFIEDYIFCSSDNLLLTDELLQKRHHIINELVDRLADGGDPQELYYWLRCTANDFEDDVYTHAVLEQFFAKNPNVAYAGKEELQEKISQLKCKDRQNACCLSIINAVRLSIGAVAAHFTPPEAHLGVLGTYWVTRFVLAKCLSSNHIAHKILKQVDNVFLGFFAAGSIQEVAEMALSPSTQKASDYIDTATSILGIISVNTRWGRPNPGDRFENIKRCWNMFSCRLYFFTE